MIIGLQRFAVIGLICWLSACAVRPPVTTPWASPFDLMGRVLVSGGERAFSAQLRWEHNAMESRLWLMSPLGQTLAQLQVDAQGVILRNAQQQDYSATSVESLTEQALGWILPWTYLQYWVTAAVVPNLPTTALIHDPQGRLLGLEQGGWRIAYDYSGQDILPRRLELRRGTQLIRFMVDTWQVEAG